MKVTTPDGAPAEGELVSACISDVCKNYTADEAGIVTGIVPPHLLVDEHNYQFYSESIKVRRRSNTFSQLLKSGMKEKLLLVIALTLQ